MMPLYPCWYDTNASCDFHYGANRHSTENCLALKHKVQALMKIGYVSFDYNKTGGPNVTSNLLPNHPRSKINALTKGLTGLVKTQLNNVKTPMENVYKALVLAKIFRPEEGKMMKGEEKNGIVCNHYCQYHVDLLGHTIHDCAEFQKMVQDLMNEKEIRVLKQRGTIHQYDYEHYLFRDPITK